MSPQSAIPLSVRDAMRILFRQKYRAGIIFLVILGLTAAAVVFTPRRYASEAKMYLRLGREDTTLDPVATQGETINVMIEREIEINSALQLLKSRGLLESVAKTIGPRAILSNRLLDEPVDESREMGEKLNLLGRLRGWLSARLGGDVVTAQEEAVKRMANWVWVDAEKKSSVITVACNSGSPRLSQRIVQELIAEFQRRHILAHRSEGSMDFFADQAGRVRDDLKNASQRLRDAKNAVGVVSVDVERNIIREHIDNLNTQIATASASLAEANMKVASLQRQHPDIAFGGQVAAGPAAAGDLASGLSVAALDEMRQELYTLQLRDLDLASKYYENYPARVAIREQVEEGRRILAEQELLMEHSNVAKYRSHLAALQQRTDAAHQKLQHLNRAEVELKELQDEVDRLHESHVQYQKNYEISRVNEALEKERITNVRVIQQPTLQNKAVSPKKMLLAVLGLMASVLGAVGVAIASEYFDPTMKTAEEVETELGVPVLVSIPEITRHQVTLNGTR